MLTVKFWQLELGDELIAIIRETSYEFPWTYGELTDAAKFERFRVYFGNDEDWPETQEFDSLFREIMNAGKFRIRNTSTGELFRNVTLNHDGRDGVWFRYS